MQPPAPRQVGEAFHFQLVYESPVTLHCDPEHGAWPLTFFAMQVHHLRRIPVIVAAVRWMVSWASAVCSCHGTEGCRRGGRGQCLEA